MTPVDLLGWASSAVLVAMIAKQVHRQWSAGTSEGVSKWLFLGQLVASVGFTIYSVMVGNAVFIVTNALMVVGALSGLTILMRHRRRERRARPHAGNAVVAPPARTARERVTARQGAAGRTRGPRERAGLLPWRARSAARGRARHAGFDK
jgi:MtN3 and saliva related transmembrane protein